MKCSACARTLPPGFPGSIVSCVCGVATTLPNASVAATPPTTPYRSSSPILGVEPTMTCPFCGHTCPPLSRICPQCDVRLDGVRCAGCYSLHAPGVFACGRCGRALELEPLVDPTDAPCPRCREPLEVSALPADERDDRVRECPRCGGMFVPRDALAEILCRAEQRRAMAEEGRAGVLLEPVTYLPCPLCYGSMNRVNFGRVSGVIVDVCQKHGTWFDGGELTRVIAFVASGGLSRTRLREEQAQREERKRRVAAVVPTAHDENDALAEWQSFLELLLF
jgi:Zn-finger nucleic acid-binding protein